MVPNYLKRASLLLAASGILFSQTMDWVYQIKNKPFIDVRAYGALPDGTTDDTSGIIAAIAAANASTTQRTVLFPAGTYLISGKIVLPSNITLLSQTTGAAIIKLKAHSIDTGTAWTYITYATNSFGIIQGTTITNTHIIGFTFAMNGANQSLSTTSNNTLAFTDATNCSVESNTFNYDFTSTSGGVVIGSPVAFFGASNNNLFSENYINGPGDILTLGGFYSGGFFIQGTGIKLFHNYVTNVTDEAFVLNFTSTVGTPTNFSVVEDNTYIGVVTSFTVLSAFHAENAQNVIYRNNICRGPVGNCYAILPAAATGQNVVNIEFSGNIGTGALNSGLTIQSDPTQTWVTTGVIVTGGQYFSNLGYGIIIAYNATNVTLNGVATHDNTSSGILILNDATRVPSRISILNSQVINNGTVSSQGPGIFFVSQDSVTGTSPGSDIQIEGNLVTDTRGSKYQTYAIGFSNAKGGYVPTLTRWRVVNNNFINNAASSINISNNNPIMSNVVIKNNIGDTQDFVVTTAYNSETGDLNSAATVLEDYHTSGTSNDYDVRHSYSGGTTLGTGNEDIIGNVRLPGIKASSGTRFICIDTNGKLVSSASACSGT